MTAYNIAQLNAVSLWFNGHLADIEDMRKDLKRIITICQKYDEPSQDNSLFSGSVKAHTILGH